MRFHLGDILSIYTETLCAPHGVQGCLDLLDFMTNDKVYLHQIPRIAHEVVPYLLEQLPWLREINDSMLAIPPDLPTREARFEASMGRVMALAATYGEYHDLNPMHLEDYNRIDPVVEAKRRMGDRPVFTFPMKEEDDEQAT